MVDDEDRERGADPEEPPDDGARDVGDAHAGDGDRPSSGGADEPPGGDAGWHDEPPEGWEESDDGNVFGEVPGGLEQPVEPGSPRLENAAFVLLGVLLALALVADLVGLL